jgi:hypothetical protein
LARINPSRLLQGIFLIWITVIAIRYATAVFKGVRSPISPGRDIEWLIIWGVTAVVLAILAAGFRYATTLVTILLICACLSILILSGTFAAGFVTSWIFAVSYGWGLRFLRFAQVQPDSPLEYISLTIPVGLIVPALAAFLLAAVHILNPMNMWLLLIALTAPAVSWLKGRFNVLTGKAWLLPFELSLPVLIIAPVLLMNFCWAVAPEIQYDANNYHLAVPRIYLANSGFVNLPYFFHSYFFRLVEMLFTLALGLQGPAAAKFMSFGFGLVTACCVFVLGKLAFDTSTGAWAAALFYTTPIVGWLSATADNDLAVAMFLTAALITFLKFRENEGNAGWLYIASLLSGATIATKINGAFGLIPLFVVGFWKLPKKMPLVIAALLFLAVSVPWYALTFYWTGNPVFPLLNGLFKSPLWAFENRVMNARDFGIGTGFDSLGRLPFRLTFDTSRFGEAAPRGTAGIALLLALPFSAVLWRYRRKAAAFLIATSMAYFLLWAYSFQYLRYYAQILPVICVLAAATVSSFQRTLWLAVAIVLQVGAIPSQFWNIPERFPIAVAVGQETREHFFKRTLVPYDAVQYLNKITKPGDRILSVEADDVRFYLNAPMESLVESTQGSVLDRTRSMPADRVLADMLYQAGFAYILTSSSALAAQASWYPYLQPDFLKQFAEETFRDPYTSVYRLKL